MSDDLDFRFVDTNILVYAHDISAGEKHTLAKEIVQDLWESESGCLSIQVLQEFYVATTVKVKKPLDSETAAKIIRDLSYWKIHVPKTEDVMGAIDLKRRERISFWDAMILWSAKQIGCSDLLSEDLNPGQTYDGVRVINPFASSTT
jgi:predicted nucleic acid-binding protein